MRVRVRVRVRVTAKAWMRVRVTSGEGEGFRVRTFRQGGRQGGGKVGRWGGGEAGHSQGAAERQRELAGRPVGWVCWYSSRCAGRVCGLLACALVRVGARRGAVAERGEGGVLTFHVAYG